MIIILYTVVPAVCCILQYILLHMFDLEEKLPQIRLELEEKRKLESVKND
jgi:Na+/melibiose symporter-like transporter